MLLELAVVLHLTFLMHAKDSSFENLWTVTCDDVNICTLESLHVFIKCSYTHTNIHTVIWFSPKQRNKWKNENHPEELALDSDFAGRVNHTETLNSSTLSIRNVRLGDSGEYRLIFITANGQQYLSPIAVNLTVTDLQVRIHPGIMKHVLHLACSTHCRLTTNWNTWWKDGRRIKAHQNTEPLILSAGDGGNYFCSVKAKAMVIQSPAVCVWGRNCWNVTYSQRRLCVLKGSSVNIHCTYSYPNGHQVNEGFWTFNSDDVRLLEQFAGRVEFVGDKESNCTLRLTNLKESDSGDYRFHFTTDTMQPAFSSSLRVELIVTDVQVRVSSAIVSDQHTVTLSCITSCTLPYHTFTWYQNSQPVMNKLTKHNHLYLEDHSYNKGDKYTCSVIDVEAVNYPAASGTGRKGWIQHALCASGGSVAILTLLIAIHFIRRPRTTENRLQNQAISNPVDDIYTGLDPTTMSPTYDTLGAVEVSLTDTYTSLNPVNRSSEYSTLFDYSRSK